MFEKLITHSKEQLNSLENIISNNSQIPEVVLLDINRHLRHTYQFFEVLNLEIINYDSRNRNSIIAKKIEANTKYGIEVNRNKLFQLIENPDKEVIVILSGVETKSTYGREFVMSHEHFIHHLATIKEKLSPYIDQNCDLGIAKSTIDNLKSI